MVIQKKMLSINFIQSLDPVAPIRVSTLTVDYDNCTKLMFCKLTLTYELVMITLVGAIWP